jgi:hypothetical protein
MRYKTCILEDQRLLRKFCLSLDKHIGCKHAYGVNKDFHGQCTVCPVAILEQACFLMNFKGMTLGEAVKAAVRAPIPEDGRWEIIKGLVEKADYPEVKENEEKAWKERQGQTPPDTEDD